ncbi:MAG TPA: DUF4190 domain-containing protein [Candidatus Nanoarchaeia archaeon]|nr:DUF4190 domain-containing protein [Candidatus Nanoarchaeia archaeon]
MEQKNLISEFAIASVVIGILSFFQLFGLEKPIAAIVFGILAIRSIRKNKLRGRNLALAGIILGVAAIITMIIITVIYYPQLQQMIQPTG